MATGTHLAFNHTRSKILNGTIDLDSDALRVVLLTAIPAATVTGLAGVTGTLSTNLAANPVTLGSNTVSVTGSSNAKMDGTDTVFTASGGTSTIAGYLIYSSSVTGNPVISYGDIHAGATSISLTAGETVTVTWNASGIYTLT